MEFQVQPVYYRIVISASGLSTETLGSGVAGNQRDGFIESESVFQIMKGVDAGVGFTAYKALNEGTSNNPDDGQPAPANLNVSIGKARGFLRWKRILQTISENQTVIDIRTITPTYANANNRNNSEISEFAFTIGYPKEDQVYTRNIEGVAGITSAATVDIFEGEEALNRQVARAISQTYAIYEMFFNPNDVQNPRIHDLVRAAALVVNETDRPTSLTTVQNAITVTKINL